MKHLYQVSGMKFIAAEDKFEAATEFLGIVEPGESESSLFDDIITVEAIKGYIYPTKGEEVVVEKGASIEDEEAVLNLCLSEPENKEDEQYIKKLSHAERLTNLLDRGYEIYDEPYGSKSE